MPVQVSKEVREDYPELCDLAVEACVKCNQSTRHWWGEGCMPLCPSCAETVTYKWCYTFAATEGYGPLPKLT